MIAAFITFAFAYRYGPPTHPKTLNLVQWTCQVNHIYTCIDLIRLLSDYYFLNILPDSSSFSNHAFKFFTICWTIAMWSINFALQL